MAHIEQDEDEKPLDPAMENVRRKMVRLQLVSAGIMGVMLMAVLAAVVYKVTQTPGKPASVSGPLSVPSDQPLSVRAALPDGFTVDNTSLSDGQVLFFGHMTDGARKAFVFDIATGRIIADIDVGSR
jgi:hypothetical protein